MGRSQTSKDDTMFEFVTEGRVYHFVAESKVCGLGAHRHRARAGPSCSRGRWTMVRRSGAFFFFYPQDLMKEWVIAISQARRALAERRSTVAAAAAAAGPRPVA